MTQNKNTGDIRERTREEKLAALAQKEDEVGKRIADLARRALERREEEK